MAVLNAIAYNITECHQFCNSWRVQLYTNTEKFCTFMNKCQTTLRFCWTCKPIYNFCDHLAWLCCAMNFAFLNDPADATAYLCKNMSMLLGLLLRKSVCIYKHLFAAVLALFTFQIILSRHVSLKVQKHLAVLSSREVVLCDRCCRSVMYTMLLFWTPRGWASRLHCYSQSHLHGTMPSRQMGRNTSSQESVVPPHRFQRVQLLAGRR